MNCRSVQTLLLIGASMAAAGWLLRPVSSPPLPVAEQAAAATPNLAEAEMSEFPSGRTSSEPEPTGEPPEQSSAPKLEVEEAPARGEPALQEALAASLVDSAKARVLLNMLSGLPEESLQTAAEQALSRLRDEDYTSTAYPILANTNTHGQILSALFADLMERPDAIALPSLLAVARNPGHPYAEAARDNLELLLGKDFGADWSAWSAEIRRRLTDGRR